MTGRVYFAECAGRIKIGYSTNVAARMKALATGAPAPITLLADVPGTQQFERAIHSALSSHRQAREWFVDCEAVRGTILRIEQHGYAAIGFSQPKRIDLRGKWGALVTDAILLKASELFHARDIRKKLAEITACSIRTIDNWRARERALRLDDLYCLLESEQGVEFLQAFMECVSPHVREPFIEKKLAEMASGAEASSQ